MPIRHHADTWKYRHSRRPGIVAAHKPQAVAKRLATIERDRRAAHAEDEQRGYLREGSLPHEHLKRMREAAELEPAARPRKRQRLDEAILRSSRLDALARILDRAHPTRFDTDGWAQWRQRNIRKLQPSYPNSAPFCTFGLLPSHAHSTIPRTLFVYCGELVEERPLSEEEPVSRDAIRNGSAQEKLCAHRNLKRGGAAAPSQGACI